jgi:hypothetical protein
LDDRRRDGGTNFILRIKEQETRLTLHEHDDDDDDDDDDEGKILFGLSGYRDIGRRIILILNLFVSTV